MSARDRDFLPGTPDHRRLSEIGRRTVTVRHMPRAATLEDWKAACVAATLALHRGEAVYDLAKHRNYEHAIVDGAGDLLAAELLGRPKGALPSAWVDVVIELARQPSTAGDGMIACSNGLRVFLSALPRASWRRDGG